MLVETLSPAPTEPTSSEVESAVLPTEAEMPISAEAAKNLSYDEAYRLIEGLIPAIHEEVRQYGEDIAPTESCNIISYETEQQLAKHGIDSIILTNRMAQAAVPAGRGVTGNYHAVLRLDLDDGPYILDTAFEQFLKNFGVDAAEGQDQPKAIQEGFILFPATPEGQQMVIDWMSDIAYRYGKENIGKLNKLDTKTVNDYMNPRTEERYEEEYGDPDDPLAATGSKPYFVKVPPTYRSLFENAYNLSYYRPLSDEELEGQKNSFSIKKGTKAEKIKMNENLPDREQSQLRELDRREEDGQVISLLWSPDDNATMVSVDDTKTGDRFTVPIREGQKAQDIFNDPYAYVAHNKVTRED